MSILNETGVLPVWLLIVTGLYFYNSKVVIYFDSIEFEDMSVQYGDGNTETMK